MFPGVFLFIRLALLAVPELWFVIGPILVLLLACQLVEWFGARP